MRPPVGPPTAGVGKNGGMVDESATQDAAAGEDVRIVLYTREDCHLCDVAFAIVEQVSLETGDEFIAVDIDYYPELRERFSDDVPVLAVDGRLVARWRFTAEMLRAALGRE